MRTLVTGGAGFIGSSLCERLLAKGHEVLCIDNFNDYYSPEAKRQNIAACMESERFRLVEANILNKTAMEGAFSSFKPEMVAHFAAHAGVRYSLENPIKCTNLNVNGTISLLDLSVKHDATGFLLASTAAVYGDSEQVPFKEESEIRPISPYAISKRCAELFCLQYHKLYGLPVSIPRFFTVYGPRQRPDMAIHIFTRLVDQGKEIPIYGSLESERDYVYISDAIDAVCSAMEKSQGLEIFNLGDSETVSLGKLVSVVEETLGKKAKIKKMPKQPCDPYKACANIEKAKRLLGYRPKVGIVEGIEKFVGWYKKSCL